MISKKMKAFVANNSLIREMFEEGKRLKAQYGEENVFDFSIGNPSTPAPAEIDDIITGILRDEKSTMIHGYMNNAGYEDVRTAVAESINKKHGTKFNASNIVMTVGAAGGLNVILKTLLEPDDEVVVFAPYFSEYRAYVDNFNGKLVVVPYSAPDFQPHLDELGEKLTDRTKVVLVNSPNNPSGVVYSEETIKKLADILRAAEKKFNTSIYIVADEPYREIAYDDVFVPYITKYYDNTIIAYSFSKSLSLPGERIGYLVVPSETADYADIFSSATVATRILGFINAPSLMQRTVAKMLEMKTDVGGYNKNREALYNGLTEAGYECVKPQGTFYLFMKSPVPDGREFCETAKKYNILMVPGVAFACPEYVRLAYCVSYDSIIGSMPKFKQLRDEVR